MTDGDYKLAFDIAREEAKIMGIYPAEKHVGNQESYIIREERKTRR